MAELRAIICLDIMGVQASGCLGVLGVSGRVRARTQDTVWHGRRIGTRQA